MAVPAPFLIPPKGKLTRAPGIGESAATLVRNSQNLHRAEEEIAFCEKQGIEMISYLDENYPNHLKYIHNAPLFLFKKRRD